MTRSPSPAATIASLLKTLAHIDPAALPGAGSSDLEVTPKSPPRESDPVTIGHLNSAAPGPVTPPPVAPPLHAQRGEGAGGWGPESPAPAPAGHDRWHPRLCTATSARTGAPCNAFRRKGNDLCAAHDPDPDVRQRMREASSRGGRNAQHTLRKFRQRHDFSFLDLAIYDRTTLQLAVNAIFRLEMTGNLTPERSRSFARLLNVSLRNLSARGHPSLTRDGNYVGSISLDRDIVRALERAALHDREREYNAISFEQARRQQRALDIERNPTLDTRATSSRRLDRFPSTPSQYMAQSGDYFPPFNPDAA